MPDTTIYKKIMEYLSSLIMANEDIPGFKLPSERSLADKFKASRRPIRFAYLKLIERGHVEKIHGKGHFVKKSIKDNSNSLKQNLKSILFITPAIKSLLIRQVVSGIEKFCEQHFLDLSIKISDHSMIKEKQFIRMAPLTNAKGIIIYPIDNEYYNGELLKLSMAKYPITIIDRQYKGLKYSYVAMDNYNAMVNTIKFLHKKKHKNIVYMTPPSSLATSIEERINGFNHGLFKYYGVAKAENLLKIKPDDLTEQQNTLTQYLQNFPNTEVVIATGIQATAVLKAAKELNIPVPQKLKLMIIDCELSDTEKAAVEPYIVEFNGYDMGYNAAAALYSQIYGDFRIVTQKLPIKIVDCSN